jgi:DNA-binding CsgD family transcriptional regulator
VSAVTPHSAWAALFWEVFARSANAMLLLDDERLIIEANGAFVALVGHRRRALMGRPVVDFLAGGPPPTIERWRASIAHGNFTGSADLLHADGSARRVRYAAHPETVAGHRVVLCVGVRGAGAGASAPRPPDRRRDPAVSARELEIVRLIALGGTGREIAEHLQLSHHTVRAHIAHAMTKLGARSRAQLVAMLLAEAGAASEPTGHRDTPPGEHRFRLDAVVRAETLDTTALDDQRKRRSASPLASGA